MNLNLLQPMRALIAGLLCLAAVLAAPAAQAQLFGGDDEARRAILDLRQRFDAQRNAHEAAQARLNDELKRASEENAQLRRGLLELQSQIDQVRAEVAQTRGRDEQIQRDQTELSRLLAETQRQQRDAAQAVAAVDERIRKLDPVKVQMDGREFLADPAEKREFEAALSFMRSADFAGAQGAFRDFLRRWAQSGYRASALFWLGNAQYGLRDYKEAMGSFRALLVGTPDHPRAAESMLAIANCQIELKDNRSARKTLEDLIAAHPQTEAANTARERLPRLRV